VVTVQLNDYEHVASPAKPTSPSKRKCTAHRRRKRHKSCRVPKRTRLGHTR
jgi:hypothetical protein